MASNPHIYVSSVHGTNTGASDTSYASQQTGAMTSLTAGNVYTDIGAAITGTTPTAGDVIYVADNHNASYDNGASVILGPSVQIISVAAANIDQYSPGATEHLSDTADDYNLNTANAYYTLYGMDLETGDDTFATSNNNDGSYLRFVDCTLRPDGNGDYAFRYTTMTAGCIDMVNVDVVAGAAGVRVFLLGGGVFVYWRGGSLSTATTLFECGGPWNALIEGVDLSSVTSLVFDEDLADATFKLTLQDCKLNASVTLPSPSNYGSRFEMYNCDDTTGAAQHRFYVADRLGTAQNNDSTYVTAGEAWSYDGTSHSSIEVTTAAGCSHATPFVFELPAQYVDLSAAASDLLTINLVTDSTAVSLTDVDIAAFLVYPDGTTPVTSRQATSGRTATGYIGIDPLHAGVALGTSALGAADWTGEPASANFYKMEIDTSGTAGAEGVCRIRIEVYKSSIASGDLFIHPIITLS